MVSGNWLLGEDNAGETPHDEPQIENRENRDMNICTETTDKYSLPIDVAPPSMARILRIARDQVRHSALLARDLLEGLEILEVALSSKIQGKKIDEEAVGEVEDLRERFASSFALGVIAADGERLLGTAYATAELDQALQALAYDGTRSTLNIEPLASLSTESLGLDYLVPSICWRELKALGGDEGEERDDF